MRLMKKQLREEELKRKQEEKAQKAELREAKRLEKQAKRLQQRKQQRDTIADVAEENVPTESLPLSSEVEISKNTKDDINFSEGNAVRGTTKRKSSSQIGSVAKRSRNNADEEIDANRCCVCFGLYSDDAGTEGNG